LPRTSQARLKFHNQLGDKTGLLGKITAGSIRKHPVKGLIGTIGTLAMHESNLPQHLIPNGVSPETRFVRIEMKVPKVNSEGQVLVEGDVIADNGLQVRLLSEAEKEAKSKGYGFVWARERTDATAAIENYKALHWTLLGIQKIEPNESGIGGNFFVYGKKV